MKRRGRIGPADDDDADFAGIGGNGASVLLRETRVQPAVGGSDDATGEPGMGNGLLARPGAKDEQDAIEVRTPAAVDGSETPISPDDPSSKASPGPSDAIGRVPRFGATVASIPGEASAEGLEIAPGPARAPDGKVIDPRSDAKGDAPRSLPSELGDLTRASRPGTIAASSMAAAVQDSRRPGQADDASLRAMPATRTNRTSRSVPGRIDPGHAAGVAADARADAKDAIAATEARGVRPPGNAVTTGKGSVNRDDAMPAGRASQITIGDDPASLAATASIAVDAPGSSPSNPLAGMPIPAAHPAAVAPTSIPAGAPGGSLLLPSAPWDASFGTDFAAQITSLAIDGAQQARIELNPQSLGPISIDLSMDDTGLSIAIDAAHQHTRAAIEQSIETLRAALADNGMRMANWSLGSNSNGADPGAAQTGGPQAGPENSAGNGASNGSGNDAGRNGAATTTASGSVGGPPRGRDSAISMPWADGRESATDRRSARLDLYA